MTAEIYYSQFLKGVQYFKNKWTENLDTPPTRRQLADFERQVIAPLDQACAKMTAAQRQKLEDEHVPF